MRKLVLVRHGDYCAGGMLTRQGVSVLRRAGDFLSTRLVAPVTMACSIQPRALNSAQLLSERLAPVRLELYPELATGRDAPVNKQAWGDMDAVHGIVERAAAAFESVILVTHHEVCSLYPDYFFRKCLGVGCGCPPLQRGEALVLDCVTGECDLLERDGAVRRWNALDDSGFARTPFCSSAE